MRPRIALSVLAVLSLLALAACGDDVESTGAGPAGTQSSATTEPPASTTATASPTETGPANEPEITKCLAKEQPKPAAKPQFSKAENVLKSGPATIVMKTSCGTLNIALDVKAGGPIPNSIGFLASKGFYDGLTFHRVVPDFVLQGGDPAGNGSGGPGYEVVGPVPDGYQYKIGDVAMAKTANAPAGASGSQFFVVSGTGGEQILTSQPVYGILGHANDPVSLATIKRIAALAVTDGPPSQPVWIISAKLVEGAVS